MRLVFFFTFEMSLAKWDAAGIINLGLSLYRALAGRGVSTDLVTWGGASDLEYGKALGPGLKVHPFFTDGPRNLWLRFFLSWLAPFKFRKMIRRADLVKTHQMWGAWSGLLCKVFFRKKWILRCGFEHHRFLLFQKACLRDRVFSRLLSWVGYRVADIVVWSNEADRKWAIDYFGLSPADPRLKVIPNFVDTTSFRPRRFLPESRRILTVARLSKQKNLDSLIRALEHSDHELEIIGGGELREELEQLARNLGVKVIFSGRLPHEQLPQRMAEARIFVLCSHYEGLSSALLEAMACGMAVVGTNVPGIKEVVTDGVNGLLAGTDPVSLRKAIDRLAFDNELCLRLGTAAARFIEENYSFKRVVELEYGLYQELLQQKNQPHRR